MNLDKQLRELQEQVKAARELAGKIRKKVKGNARRSLRLDLEYVEDDLRYLNEDIEACLP